MSLPEELLIGFTNQSAAILCL